MKRIIVGACSVLAIVSGSTALAAPAAAIERPEARDQTLLADCREYQKVSRGRPGNVVKAQACRAFIAGFVLGWENRQNTPVEVLPQTTCASNFDRVVNQYVADEMGNGGTAPPNINLMGELLQRFPCGGR